MAALIEPLSSAVHGPRRIGPVLGQDVLLMGAGTMGLLLLQLLGRAGARSLTVDRKASRLEAAKAVGAATSPTTWPRPTARPWPWPWTRPARPMRSKPPSNPAPPIASFKLAPDHWTLTLPGAKEPRRGH